MSSLRCQIGDLVQFDCPQFPRNHGRKARVVGSAAFNGPDWWEVELLHEFALVPDMEHSGNYVKTSQSYAPDSILKPITEVGEAPAAPPLDESFFVVDSSGIIFGPAMTIDEAREKVALKNRASVEIVPAWLAMDIVARASGASLARFEIAALLDLTIEDSSKEAV